MSLSKKSYFDYFKNSRVICLVPYYYKDGEQTLHEATDSATIDAEGTTKLWYFSVDKAGNSEEPKDIIIKIDKTDPTITYKDRTDPNANGWNKTDVTVDWTCEDEVSGALDGLVSKILTTEGQNQPATGICADNAGNTSQNTQTGISIDKTAPQVSVTTPKNEEKYTLKSIVNADWSTSDNLSGLASTTPTLPSGSPIDTSSIGSKSFTVTATDKAGNTTIKTVTYKVIYRFDGFLQPINDTGHTQTCGGNCSVSIFKGNSTVPVKLQIKDADGNPIQSATPPQWITPQKGSALTQSVNESDYTDATDSGTTYSWDGSQYHYNWKTKDFASGYYWLIGVKLDDNQTYTVNVGLR